MASERWEIDSSHSSLHFSVRHLVIAKVRGSFARWSGTIQVPDGDFSKATVAVTIDASSIDTGVADRDGASEVARLLRRGAVSRTALRREARPAAFRRRNRRRG